MRCTKNEPRESSSTSDSVLPTSSSAGRSEDAVVLFLAGFLITLVFGRTGLTGLSCGLTGLSCGFAGLSCDGFLFQNGSSLCQKNNHTFREYLDRSKFRHKGYMILTAGGLLKVQKGSSLVWAQTTSGSFSIFFTASVTSSSVS